MKTASLIRVSVFALWTAVIAALALTPGNAADSTAAPAPNPMGACCGNQAPLEPEGSAKGLTCGPNTRLVSSPAVAGGPVQNRCMPDR